MFAIWNWNLFNVSKDVKQNAKHLLNIVSKDTKKIERFGSCIISRFSFPFMDQFNWNFQKSESFRFNGILRN